MATPHVKKPSISSTVTKVVLTGDPVAWERGTRVSGKQITIFLAEERSVVEGGSHVRIEGEGTDIRRDPECSR
jgi:hypothetical protein